MAGTQDLMEALNDLRERVGQVHTSQEVMRSKMETLHDETAKMRRTLTGESEPERSVVHRLMRVEESVGEMQGARKAVSAWAWGAAGTAVLAALSAWWKGAS